MGGGEDINGGQGRHIESLSLIFAQRRCEFFLLARKAAAQGCASGSRDRGGSFRGATRQPRATTRRVCCVTRGDGFVGLRVRLVCRPASWKLVERDDRVRGTGEDHGDMRKSRACDRQAVKCPAACDTEGRSGEPNYTRTLTAVCGVRHVIVRKR